ncbi:MAG TPA: Ig-like domain-containing protein [Gemmatimonadales bacterium]|nr:Ig-like domain-containing protein [Gemmatimonadales bacterium]
MRRILKVGASFALALVVSTCVDRTLTGPHLLVRAGLNLAALAQPVGSGLPPVPFDSLDIRFYGADSVLAYEKIIGFSPDTMKGDSVVVPLTVPLDQSPETFTLVVRAYGGGVTWYTGTSTIQLSEGPGNVASTLAVQYVGPGANAARVSMAPVDTTAVGGTPFALHATVYDSSGKAIAGVPVGYRVSDTTAASVSYPTPFTGNLTGKPTVRESLWVVATTPTKLKDSTFVHIVPPAVKIVKVAGDSQTSVINAALPVALGIRVVDALGGGFKGDTVKWAITAGVGTLPAGFSLSDSTGLATMPVTPTQAGGLSVQATVTGLTGSPITFTETGIAGSIKTVTISPKIDTLLNGLTLQYTAVAKDPVGNPVSTTFGWTVVNTTVASVTNAGLATALAGDSTKVIATAGGISDTARLYVRALRTLAITPLADTVRTVGDSLVLSTTATDNFGAPITTGLNIRYLSVSSIATVNSVTGHVKIIGAGGVSPANTAIIQAKDSVATSDSLVRGSATVVVQQVLAKIVNAPPDSIEVGVGGQGQIVGVPEDSNSYAIPGAVLGWASRSVAMATVSASGGVTGVALGATYAVDSLNGLKDSTRISVVTAPPKQILWGFDSTSIGNGGNAGIPLIVTLPPPIGTPALNISITSSDTTIAKASPNQVTIGVGASNTSVTIYGLKAGRVVLTATDVSGLGYASRTMIVGVVSTITFRETASPCCQQQYFYVNQNQTHSAQVWLSDPAPAGGLGITFVYGRPGSSSVTPSPAVIPAGQLSANITITGLNPVSPYDSVVPTSGGYIGKFSYVYVASDSLKLSQPYPGTGLVGVGQYIQPYAYITYAMDHPLVLSAAMSSAIGTTKALDTIPTSGTSTYLTVSAVAKGYDTLTISAPGWVSTKLPYTFTTPELIVSGGTSIIAGDPSDGSVIAYTADSTGQTHQVTASVPVTIVSRNTAAVAIDTPTTLVVPPGTTAISANTLRAIAGDGGDSSWIVGSAPGYSPDSFKVYTTKPTLTFSVGYPYDARIALGTVFQNAGYVQIPYAQPSNFWVVFRHSQKQVITGPDSVMIPQGSTVGYFNAIGDTVTGDTARTDSMSVTRATGYVFSATPVVWTADQIHVRPYTYPTTLYTISAGQYVTAIVVDSVDGQSRPLVKPLSVTMRVSNTDLMSLDSLAVTIPTNGYFTSPDSLRVLATPVSDSARVYTAALGSTGDSTAEIHLNLTPLTFALGYPGNGRVGDGLQLANSYVYLPAAAPNSLTVAIQRFTPAKDSLSGPSVLIPKGATTSSYFTIVGLDSTGGDSLQATLTGFVTAKAKDSVVPDTLEAGRLGASHLTTEPPELAYVYIAARNGYYQAPVNPLTFTIQSSDSTVIQIDSAGTLTGTDLGTSTIPTTQYYAYYRVKYVGSGTARVRISAPAIHGDSTELVTVTGPSLSLSYATATAGQGQIFQGEYVYVANAVTSPLVVYFARSDSSAAPASQVFTLCASGVSQCSTQTDSVIIPANGYSSNGIEIDGQNQGSANLIARAAGYNSATTSMSIGAPRLLTTTKTLPLYVGQEQAVYVYTEDQTNSNRIVGAPLVIKDSSTQASVVVGDSVTKTIPARGASTYYYLTGLSAGSADVIYETPNYKYDTTVVSVIPGGQLSLTGSSTVSVGNTVQLELYLPFTVGVPVTVTLNSTNPSYVSVPVSVTIPAGQSYVYFMATGVAAGPAMITASATNFTTSTGFSITAQ